MASLVGYFATMLYNPNNVGGRGLAGDDAARARGRARSWRAMIGYRRRRGSGATSPRAGRSPTSRRSGSRASSSTCRSPFAGQPRELACGDAAGRSANGERAARSRARPLGAAQRRADGDARCARDCSRTHGRRASARPTRSPAIRSRASATREFGVRLGPRVRRRAAARRSCSCPRRRTTRGQGVPRARHRRDAARARAGRRALPHRRRRARRSSWHRGSGSTPVIACVSVLGTTEERRGGPRRPGRDARDRRGGARARVLPARRRRVGRLCGRGHARTPTARAARSPWRAPTTRRDVAQRGRCISALCGARSHRLGDDRSAQAGLRAVSRRRGLLPRPPGEGAGRASRRRMSFTRA